MAAVGLAGCSSIHGFRSHVMPETMSGPDEEEIDDGDFELPVFVPDQSGHKYRLPDGVEVQLRMYYVQGRYRLEWQLPRRSVHIPEDKDPFVRMKKFIKHGMEAPHRKITLSEEARGAFMSFQTMYNIKVKQARDENDADSGAEWGIAPWKLGQFSAAILLWDIMWGVKVPMYKEVPWVIELQHVTRAYKLMSILDQIREGFRTNCIKDAAVIVGAAAAVSAKLSEDRDLEGCTHVNGTWGTEIARRILFRSQPVGVSGEHKCHSMKTFQLFTPKERARVEKVPVSVFREIAKLCPAVLGKFDTELDALVWCLPDELTDELVSALQDYANVKPQSLKDSMKTCGSRPGGPRRSRSEVAASQS